MRVPLIIAIGVMSSGARASPPPPPPSFIEDIARQLVANDASSTAVVYAGLLADDLTVTLDGRTVVTNKADWLALQRSKLGKVDRFVYGYATGRDNVLVVERFDDKSDEHCPPGHECVFDPRYHVRALRYQIGADRLVHAIRILQSDGTLRSP